MVRSFLTRTETDDVDAVVEAVASRENELASYDANVLSYEQQLEILDATLPAEWPAEIARFKGTPNDRVHAAGTAIEAALLVSQLNHRDRIRMLLFTEKAERAKSELAYTQMLSRMPTDAAVKRAALDRYAAKVAAQKAKNP